MKKRLSAAIGLLIALTGGLFYFGPKTVYARELTEDQRVIDFEDRKEGAQVLSGKYEDCNFGNMGWNTGEAGGSVKLWADSLTRDGQVNKIAIPYGNIFRGFSASCSESATIEVISGSESNTFKIGSEEKEYTTDFVLNNMAVYLVIRCEDGVSDVKIDNLVLEETDMSKMNISEGKPVTTSGDCERPASNGNDGNYQTMWVHNGGGANKWWQVDLEDQYVLTDYEITFEKEESNPWKYKIEASSDGEHFDVLADKTQNEETAKIQKGTMDAGTEYRYVRVTITGLPGESYWCAFAEFKVFTENMMTNVALGKETAQSDGNNSASLGVDGDMNTFAGNSPSFPYWWTVDLGKSYQVKKVEIEWEDLYDGETNLAEDWKYKIEYSADGGSTWKEVADYTSQTPYTDPVTSVLQSKECDIECNTLKVTITDKPSQRPLAWAAIPEFRAFAVDTDPVVPEEPGQNINIDTAYGQPVRASSSADGFAASNTTDYMENTTWKPADTKEAAYLQVNLDRAYRIRNHTVDFASSPEAYKLFVSSDGKKWIELADITAQNAGKKHSVKETEAQYVKFEFPNPSDALEIKEIHFDALDAGHADGRKILVLAPHEDDEMLMAGGIMKRALEVGEDVRVLLATNGDYNGKSTGEGRIVEAVNALDKIGLSKENILFLGYADTGGLGGAQTYQDSFLYKLYTGGDEEVFKSRWNNEYTYGNSQVKQDYHYEKWGEHAAYTRANFLNDLQTAISEYCPTDIYVPSRYDMHFDHTYLGMFAIEAIQNIQKQKPDYNPILHESIIHSCAGDNNWPIVNSDAQGILALNMPEGLEKLTMFKWDERENVNVPYSMRQTPFAFNLKDQALRLYTSQYYGYIGSFAKVNEIFWPRDFSSIAKKATVTASSQQQNSDKKIDQSAVKAVDGIRDGYASGLPHGHTRYPHAEWVTAQETTGAWINLEFEKVEKISKVLLYDRPNSKDQILGGKLVFDDGSEVEVGKLPNNGRPLEVQVDKESRNVRFVVTSVSESTENVGLAEIEIY